MLRTTSKLVALACLMLSVAAGLSLGQTTTPPTTTPATPTAPTTPTQPQPGLTPQPTEGVLLGQDGLPLPPELPPVQPVLPEAPDEPGEPAPLTAAERFAALQRFGMSVFGAPEPQPAAREEAPARTGEATRPAEAREGAPRPAQPAPQPAAPAPQPAPAPRQTQGVVASEAVPPTYVLGPGDQLVVRVWTDAIEHVSASPVIDADGQIYLELLGELTVGGERLSSARDLIARRYRTFFTRAEVSVGLAGTRVIEVRVTGDVRRPGTHVLSGAATLFSALNAAGGPNEVGSFRTVMLMRSGEEPQEVELYANLLRGEIDADLPREPNDTVFVPPMLAEFGIDGEVRRPARYEMIDEVTLADALQMAAGIGGAGYAQGAELWRVGESGTRELMNVNLRGEDAQLTLQSGDLLVIPPVLEKPLNVVELTGAVRRPGTYQVSAEMTVSDLLRLAQGPVENANVEESGI